MIVSFNISSGILKKDTDICKCNFQSDITEPSLVSKWEMTNIFVLTHAFNFPVLFKSLSSKGQVLNTFKQCIMTAESSVDSERSGWGSDVKI